MNFMKNNIVLTVAIIAILNCFAALIEVANGLDDSSATIQVLIPWALLKTITIIMPNPPDHIDVLDDGFTTRPSAGEVERN